MKVGTKVRVYSPGIYRVCVGKQKTFLGFTKKVFEERIITSFTGTVAEMESDTYRHEDLIYIKPDEEFPFMAMLYHKRAVEEIESR